MSVNDSIPNISLPKSQKTNHNQGLNSLASPLMMDLNTPNQNIKQFKSLKSGNFAEYIS